MSEHGNPIDTSSDDGLPTVTLQTVDQSVDIIKQFQAIILKHPVASKAAFAALMAEGRAYARTPEGAQLLGKIERSELLHRARMLLDLPGLSALEDDRVTALPSTLLDTIFMMASNSENNEYIAALFEWDKGDDFG